MREATIEAFWQRFVTRAGAYRYGARGGAAGAHAGLPEAFLALTTRGAVGGVAAPGLHVGPVGDWLGHALARHAAMRALADAHGNPVLAAMVPFGDTADPFEVALELDAGSGSARVVWLDPERYDSPGDGVVGVVGATLEAYVRRLLAATNTGRSRAGNVG